MSAGRILQLGSPHEIYHAPVDRFVADFIGDTNFLSLTVAATDGNTTTVELPGGCTTSAQSAQGYLPVIGEAITTVIRPEQARICSKDEANFDAILESSVFFGTDTHLHLRLSDGQPFILRQQNAGASPPIDTGTLLPIALSPNALRILRD